MGAAGIIDRRDPIDRTIWALAIPSLGALAIEPLYATADTIIIGRLGTTELAGLAIAAQILIVLSALANFLAYATTQRVAAHRGAGDETAAAIAGRQALGLAVVLGVALSAVLLLFGEAMARTLGARDGVLDVAVEYLGIRALGMPAVLWALAALGILRGVRDMVSPLRIIAAAAVANVIIEVVMVFGLGWGVAGAALSTVVVQWVAVVAYALVTRPHLVAAHRWVDPVEARALMNAGGWLVVRVTALIAALTIATAAAARLGEASLAAHQILSTVFLVAALSLDALAIPAQTLIGETTGSADEAAARRIARRILRAAGRAAAVIAIVVIATAWLVPMAFTSDAEVRQQATGALLVLAVLLLPGAYAFALDGILIGAGRYRALGAAMAISLMVFAVALAALWPVRFGLATIWVALAIWMAARAVITLRIWQRGVVALG